MARQKTKDFSILLSNWYQWTAKKYSRLKKTPKKRQNHERSLVVAVIKSSLLGKFFIVPLPFFDSWLSPTSGLSENFRVFSGRIGPFNLFKTTLKKVFGEKEAHWDVGVSAAPFGPSPLASPAPFTQVGRIPPKFDEEAFKLQSPV